MTPARSVSIVTAVPCTCGQHADVWFCGECGCAGVCCTRADAEGDLSRHFVRAHPNVYQAEAQPAWGRP